MRKKFTFILCFVFFVLIVSACSSSTKSGSTSKDTENGDTLIVGAAGNPQTFNPNSRGDDYFYPIAQNIYSRLVKINNNFEILPDLAKEWEVSDDGTEFTFLLQENVKWHDGEDFSCSDVKFTLDSVLDNQGFAANSLSTIQEVTCVDDNTVEVTLDSPDATFLGNLSWYGTFILPEHVFSGDNWDAGTNIDPVGTGPFKFVKYEPGKNLDLEKNEDYFGQVPYVDKLIYSIISDPNTMVQAFYNQELDILGNTPPTSELKKMQEDPEIIATEVLFPSRNYIVFNFDEEPFNDVKVRHAVAHAIDNEDISNKIDMMEAEYFLTPVYDWAMNDDYKIPTYDPDKAEELLQEAGYTKDNNGNYLEIVFDVFESGSFLDIAKIVQFQLGEVGIDIELNVMEYAAWQGSVRDERNYVMSMLGGFQGPDIGAVDLRISTTGDNNFMGYSNSKLDDLLDEGKALIDEEDRAPKYKEIQKILYEDLPIYPVVEFDTPNNPYHSYVKGHPLSDEAIGLTGFSEYTYVQIEK